MVEDQYHCVISLEKVNAEKFADMQAWCFDTFGDFNARWSTQITPKYEVDFMFKNEAEAMLFSLRWAQ